VYIPKVFVGGGGDAAMLLLHCTCTISAPLCLVAWWPSRCVGSEHAAGFNDGDDGDDDAMSCHRPLDNIRRPLKMLQFLKIKDSNIL
jgi:hypothetical protein